MRRKTTPRSAYALCREWRQAYLRQQYEVSMAPEGDDEAVALAVAVSDATMHELERDILAASMTTVDDVSAVLGVALTIMGEELTQSERAALLIRAARRGLEAVRNSYERRAA